MKSPYAEGGIACSNCTSACCRKGINILLTEKEFSTLKSTTELRKCEKETPLVKPKLSKRIGAFFTRRAVETPEFYEMMTDCGNLITTEEGTSCGVYNTAEMPEVCSGLEQAGFNCLQIRSYSGVPKPTFIENEIIPEIPVQFTRKIA